MNRLPPERRHDARFTHERVAGLRATVRPGWPAAVVDLSAGGALIEGSRALRPGARVHLQVSDGTRRVAMAAHVLRCAVAVVDPERGVRYRAALRFDQPCPLLAGEHWTRDGSAVPTPAGSTPGLHGHTLPVARTDARAEPKGRRK